MSDECELENKHVVFDKDLRNKCRKIFLKELKKVIILKSEIDKNIKIKEIEMAKQAKIEDIVIPIFDGENYSSWKIRLMMLLEYKECQDPADRVRKQDENEADWKKKDLKARTILVSTILDKQLEYVKDCRTALEMITKFDKIYITQSTALQILCRGKIDEMKLKDYDTVEEFFIVFEKAVNEFKSAGGTIDESEKMRYLLKALPPNYSYIGDFIDVIPVEQRTVDYVKTKIKEKNMNKNQHEKKANVSTFTTRARGQCHNCGKPGHLQRECWQIEPKGQDRDGRQVQGGSQRGHHRGSNRGGQHRGRGRGRGYQTSQQRGEYPSNSRNNGSSGTQAWATRVLKKKKKLLKIIKSIATQL